MAEVIVAVVGIAMVIATVLANQTWLDRHFLPSFLMSRLWYVGIETAARVALAGLGLGLAFGARRLGRWLRTFVPRDGVRVAVAILLAVTASELALQRVHLRPTEWRILDEEPRREPDAELGWKFIPNRTAHATSGGRTIQYSFDAAGYRVRSDGNRVDVERPSILFAGESVIFGDGLTYDESVPGQVEATLGVQAVNFGVYGFSTDQTYLRLRKELPRFRRPVAVVAPFMTTLFGRNLDDDRPHLTNGLVWQPAHEHGRVATLTGLFFPFRRDATVQRGISVTREVLVAIVNLARARHATPLIVVPHLGPESEPERSLRHHVLDEAAVPYVFVSLDSTWHIAWDHHPDARAARVIATAIASRLRADRDPASSSVRVEGSQ
jgi:cell shape-determining protein MreD